MLLVHMRLLVVVPSASFTEISRHIIKKKESIVQIAWYIRIESSFYSVDELLGCFHRYFIPKRLDTAEETAVKNVENRKNKRLHVEVLRLKMSRLTF